MSSEEFKDLCRDACRDEDYSYTSIYRSEKNSEAKNYICNEIEKKTFIEYIHICNEIEKKTFIEYIQETDCF